MKRILLSTLMFLAPLFALCQNYQKQAAKLDKYIEEVLQDWNPPGLAVTVVKDGLPVFTKTYGTISTASNDKVDEHTLFVCASTTKAFTAAALAILADDGVLNWDDKVIDHLPEFRLKDPFVTNELTIRDLLTHRSGLGNTDYLWTWMDIGSDSAVYRLRDSDLRYSLRSSFIYQNLMYLTAGEVVESASGMRWDRFLRDRIYEPLGMNETYGYYADAVNMKNIASGHYLLDEKIRPIQQLSADAIGPAGSMWSSITDMGKWIRFLDNDGIINGDTLISRVNFEELFKPQQLIPPNQFYPSMQLTKPNWMSYGLGWFQHDYKGKKVDFHTGSLPGMVAIAGLIREENIGVYVFSNLDHTEIRHAIMYATFDIFLDGKLSLDWSSELKAIYDERNNNDDDDDPERAENAPASIPLDSLVGDYYNEKYGTVRIQKSDNVIEYILNEAVTGTIQHFHYDTYEISYSRAWYGKGLISFRRNNLGELDYLEVWGQVFNKK